MNGTRAHRPRRQAVTVTALSQATFCSHCSSRSLDISHWRRWSKINSTNTGSRCLTTVLHWVDQLHHNTDTGVTRAWTHFTTTQTLESLQPGLTSPQHRHWSHSSLDSLHHNIDTGVAPAWTHFTTTQTLESLQPGLTSPQHRHWSRSCLDSLHNTEALQTTQTGSMQRGSCSGQRRGSEKKSRKLHKSNHWSS